MPAPAAAVKAEDSGKFRKVPEKIVISQEMEWPLKGPVKETGRMTDRKR